MANEKELDQTLINVAWLQLERMSMPDLLHSLEAALIKRALARMPSKRQAAFKLGLKSHQALNWMLEGRHKPK